MRICITILLFLIFSLSVVSQKLHGKYRYDSGLMVGSSYKFKWNNKVIYRYYGCMVSGKTTGRYELKGDSLIVYLNDSIKAGAYLKYHESETKRQLKDAVIIQFSFVDSLGNNLDSVDLYYETDSVQKKKVVLRNNTFSCKCKPEQDEYYFSAVTKNLYTFNLGFECGYEWNVKMIFRDINPQKRIPEIDRYKIIQNSRRKLVLSSTSPYGTGEYEYKK